MVERGVITCSRKTFHPGKIVAGFLFGTKRLYQFIHNNPLIELHPTDYVNDPFNIAQNNAMVAINSALEVDLTGQVCADSVAHGYTAALAGRLILFAARRDPRAACQSSLCYRRREMER